LNSALIILTGCDWAVPVEDLISPPRLTDEQTEIFKALTNCQGSGLILKYPKTGEYRSAFVIREENPLNVMVFYQLTGFTGEPTLWMTFLVKQDGKWECTYELPFFATDIEKIEFSALGDREDENIIVSYSLLNQAEKGVSIINFTDDGLPDLIYKIEYCVYYAINDFTQSGKNNLFYIEQDRLLKTSEAIFVTWRENRFVYLGGVDLNPEAAEYIKVTEGFVTENKPALFLEYTRGDTTCNTSVISWQGNRLYNVVYTNDEQKREENLTLLEKKPNAYTCPAFSRDIDGDGVTEAGGNADFPGYYYSTVNPHDIVRAAVWYRAKGTDSLEQLYYTYLSVNNDYVFFFPENWIDNVTVTVSPNGNEVVFWEYEPENFETVFDVNTEILSITAVLKGEEFDGNQEDGWFLYDDKSSGQFDYYVKIWGENFLRNDCISREDLNEALKIFVQES
jgi:hypothetical protein